MKFPPGGRPARLVTAGLLISLGACELNEAEDVALQVPGAPVGLSEAPVLTVGERPGDLHHELFAVGTPFLLPDGGLAVPSSGDATIRIYDATGEFVRSMGSEGEGPGEFMRLAMAWARGDTIEAFDPELNRITRFTPGAPPRTIMLEGVASAQVAVPGLIDGTWVLYGVQEVQPSGRDRIAVHRFASDGQHLGVVQQTEGFRRHLFPGGGGPDPISPRAVVRTRGPSVYVAETLTPRVTVTDVQQGEVRSVEWMPGASVSGDDAARIAREGLLTSGLGRGEQSWSLSSFNALSGHEEASAFWDFLVDGEEFLWVRAYEPRIHATHAGGLQRTGPGGVWSVLDRHGAEVAEVTVPVDFEPLSIESDLVIGIRRDRFDVESVRVYRIERSGG